jgi:hypothetical protein
MTKERAKSLRKEAVGRKKILNQASVFGFGLFSGLAGFSVKMTERVKALGNDIFPRKIGFRLASPFAAGSFFGLPEF